MFLNIIVIINLGFLTNFMIVETYNDSHQAIILCPSISRTESREARVEINAFPNNEILSF